MRHLHFLYCKQNETAGAVRMKEETGMYLEFRRNMIITGAVMMAIVAIYMVFLVFQLFGGKGTAKNQDRSTVLPAAGIAMVALGLVKFASIFVLMDDSAWDGLMLVFLSVIAGTGFFCTGSDGAETAEAQPEGGGETDLS